MRDELYQPSLIEGKRNFSREFHFNNQRVNENEIPKELKIT